MGWCSLVQGRRARLSSVDCRWSRKSVHHAGESVDFAALTWWVRCPSSAGLWAGVPLGGFRRSVLAPVTDQLHIMTPSSILIFRT